MGISRIERMHNKPFLWIDSILKDSKCFVYLLLALLTSIRLICWLLNYFDAGILLSLKALRINASSLLDRASSLYYFSH